MGDIMKEKDFGITNELYGYERFVTQILKGCNDKALRNVIEGAWGSFRKDQITRDDVLPGWGLVETMCIRDDGKVGIGLG
jgi:hypothetical protein